ncbi:MAG TPA: hypothetical protein VMU24_08350 [Candidatus Acidoferrales bacterium]|nr:hypothetical protein [Candidatus Acidoferrales bacterium]
MKSARFLLLMFVVLTLAVPLLARGNDGENFRLISFDPRGSTETHAFAINNSGAVVGYYIDANRFAVGYERFPDGKIVPLSLTTGGLQDQTYFEGLNNFNVIAGYYYPNPSNVPTGILLFGGNVVKYSFEPNYATQVLTVNDRGEVGGAYYANPLTGFLELNNPHRKVSISVSGSTSTYILCLNNFEYAGGAYSDSSGNFHAFLRKPDGTIEDLGPKTWVQSSAYGINNWGLIVGSAVDSHGVFHGFYGQPEDFRLFDYPGATFTVLTGVNDDGEMSGRYIDQSGKSHGFILLHKGE